MIDESRMRVIIASESRSTCIEQPSASNGLGAFRYPYMALGRRPEAPQLGFIVLPATSPAANVEDDFARRIPSGNRTYAAKRACGNASFANRGSAPHDFRNRCELSDERSDLVRPGKQHRFRKTESGSNRPCAPRSLTNLPRRCGRRGATHQVRQGIEQRVEPPIGRKAEKYRR